MKVEVQNNVPGIKVSIGRNADGTLSVTLVESESKKLGDVEPGSVVTLGDREYIVLGHADETTAVITKDFVKQMEFGSFGDYEKSEVRSYCNDEFYKELAKAVGKDNIIQHTVRLEANDGTGKGKTCKDFVSIITTGNYRRYREFLKPYGEWWWTANSVTYDDPGYTRYVCCVNARGILDWWGNGCCGGVRPFCILSSSISVS